MDLGVGVGPRPGAVAGHLHAEVLVGGDVEAAPLELVEQPEAGAADVGGVAPAHDVAPVGAGGRADAVDDGVVRRAGQRADGRAQPLLGVVGVGEGDGGDDRGDHGDGGRGRRRTGRRTSTRRPHVPPQRHRRPRDGAGHEHVVPQAHSVR